MIDLKCCTVLVNNKAEYIALIKEAQKQGYTWADGTALTNIFCDFPTRLRFNGECKVYYNSSAYFYNRDYQCNVFRIEEDNGRYMWSTDMITPLGDLYEAIQSRRHSSDSSMG